MLYTIKFPLSRSYGVWRRISIFPYPQCIHAFSNLRAINKLALNNYQRMIRRLSAGSPKTRNISSSLQTSLVQDSKNSLCAASILSECKQYTLKQRVIRLPLRGRPNSANPFRITSFLRTLLFPTFEQSTESSMLSDPMKVRRHEPRRICGIKPYILHSVRTHDIAD